MARIIIHLSKILVQLRGERRHNFVSPDLLHRNFSIKPDLLTAFFAHEQAINRLIQSMVYLQVFFKFFQGRGLEDVWYGILPEHFQRQQWRQKRRLWKVSWLQIWVFLRVIILLSESGRHWWMKNCKNFLYTGQRRIFLWSFGRWLAQRNRGRGFSVENRTKWTPPNHHPTSRPCHCTLPV